MINVDIDLGRHTMQVPYGMKKLFVNMIESLEITQGNFNVHLGENIRGGTKKGMKFIKLLPEYNAMLLKAQPSGKDGRHVCTVYFPDMYKEKLMQFAERLTSSDEVGYENLAEDESFETEKEEQLVPLFVSKKLLETELAAAAIVKQQKYEVEKSILSQEMMGFIVSDIFEKKGTSWIEKKTLFKLLDEFKLECATNRLIGRLLRMGYLEDDPGHSGKRSRLTKAACLLISVSIDASIPADAVVTKEDDARILSMLELLKQAADEYSALSGELAIAVADLEMLNAKDARLNERLNKITLLIAQKVEENERRISQKKIDIESILAKITPRLIEADRRLNLITSELPSE